MHLRGKVFDKPEDPAGAGAAPAPKPSDPPASDPPADPPKPSDPPVDPPAQGAKPGEPPAPKPDWKDGRIAKLTHDLNEAKRQLAAAPAGTPPAQNPGESETDFNTRVDAAATEKAQEMALINEWTRRCVEVNDAGKKEFADFGDRLKAIQGTINGADEAEVTAYNEVLATAMETGQAHKLIYSLGADPGEFSRIMGLTPVKRAMELATMATKLTSDPEPSGLPKPITPINGGNGQHYEGIQPDDPKLGTKLPLADWMAKREAQVRAKGLQ